MLLRERNITQYPHPCYRSFTLSLPLSSASKNEHNNDMKTEPVILSCHMLTGDFRLSGAAPTIFGCPGGFLCDEPVKNILFINLHKKLLF